MISPCPKMPCDSIEGGVENNTEFEKGKIFSLKITSRQMYSLPVDVSQDYPGGGLRG